MKIPVPDRIPDFPTQISLPTRSKELPLIVIFTAITLLGAAARFYHIGARPVHYDEGVHLFEAWNLIATGTYTYTGFVHGPPLIYASAVLFRIFGADIVVGRIFVAILSLGMFPALYLLRDRFSPISLGVAGLVLAIHPWSLYVARFYRNDVLVATFALLAIGLYAQYLRKPNRYTAGLLGLSLVLAVAFKPVGYVVVGALTVALLLIVHFDWRFGDHSVDSVLCRYAPERMLRVVGASAFLSLLVFFGGWPPNPIGAPSTLIDSILVWVARSSRGAYTSVPVYYLRPLLMEVPYLFGFALVGSLGTLLNPRSSWFRWFFLAWAGLAGFVLSLHDHQWPWLFVHILVPVALLAGAGVTDVVTAATAICEKLNFSPSPTGQRVFALLVTALLVAPLIMGSVAGDPRDVSGVTSPANSDVEKNALAFAKEESYQELCRIHVGPSISLYPAKWHLRVTDHVFLDAWNDSVVQSPSIVVSTEQLDNVTNASVRTFENAASTFYVYTPDAGCL